MTAIAFPDIPTPDPRTLDEPARTIAEALADRYAIKRMIGRGGMGIVYLARDRRLNRLVAIKTLPPHLAADGTVRTRFLREAQTAAGLSHPNIVPIHCADEIDGHVFFEMGHVDGESLASRIRAHGRLDDRTVLGYLSDVASALAHAHPRGVIHRDVKPENILIDRATNRAMVTDFGIARVVEAAPLTATGQVLGTVYYVSPEQASGDHVDQRSDLYSLGVVGYVALSGAFPFDSALASAVLIAHVTKMPAPLASLVSTVTPALAVIIDRLLAKNPDNRYASAALLFDALEAARPAVERHLASGSPATHLVSDTEAHAVWRRAAELQALTGVQPRPALIPAARDRETDDARTSGFRVDDIRAAANEAGIGTAYVEHALVERGLGVAPPTLPATVTRPPAVRPPSSFWAGVPLMLVEEAELNDEMSPDDFERIVNLVRDATGELGTPTDRFRELGWRFGPVGYQLDVSVVPRDGRTHIRLAQNIRSMAAMAMSGSAVFGAVAFPLVTAMSFSLMSWVSHMGIGSLRRLFTRGDMRMVALAIGVSMIPLSIHLGRRFVRWSHDRHASRHRTLMEAVVGRARELIRLRGASRG